MKKPAVLVEVFKPPPSGQAQKKSPLEFIRPHTQELYTTTASPQRKEELRRYRYGLDSSLFDSEYSESAVPTMLCRGDTSMGAVRLTLAELCVIRDGMMEMCIWLPQRAGEIIEVPVGFPHIVTNNNYRAQAIEAIEAIESPPITPVTTVTDLSSYSMKLAFDYKDRSCLVDAEVVQHVFIPVYMAQQMPEDYSNLAVLKSACLTEEVYRLQRSRQA